MILLQVIQHFIWLRVPGGRDGGYNELAPEIKHFSTKLDEMLLNSYNENTYISQDRLSYAAVTN